MLFSESSKRKDQLSSLPKLQKSSSKPTKVCLRFLNSIEFFKHNLKKLKNTKKPPKPKPKDPIPSKKSLNYVKLTLPISPPGYLKKDPNFFTAFQTKVSSPSVRNVKSLKMLNFEKGVVADKIKICGMPKGTGAKSARLCRGVLLKPDTKGENVEEPKKVRRNSILITKETCMDPGSDSSADCNLDPVLYEKYIN